jgi:hypothetical protein
MADYTDDSSKESWVVYKRKYKSSDWDFWDEFDFENIKTRFEKDGKYDNERYLLWLKDDSKFLEKLGRLFSFGGEKVFNFGKKNSTFKKIIDSDNNSQHKEYCINLLKECESMHSSKYNISILPTTGGLNNVKGSLYFDENNIEYSNRLLINKQLDRFDTFIAIMSDYFKKNSELALSYCKGKANEGSLKEFLTLFDDDIYKFCYRIYLINDEIFVDKLVENGKKPIENTNDVVRYCHLAKEYWEKSKESLSCQD